MIATASATANATPYLHFQTNNNNKKNHQRFCTSLRFNHHRMNAQTHHYQQQHSSSNSNSNTTGDPELMSVLEIATNSELFDIHSILFGPSYLSPLLKSVSNDLQIDRFMIEEDLEERHKLIHLLHSRFLFLAADARSTLRGYRPSYRNVLLDVRKQLLVPCSSKLPLPDLELEIFIFMLQECSRDSDAAAALTLGPAHLCSLLLKGGQLVSLLKISQLVSTKLSGKMVLEASTHRFGSEVIKKIRILRRHGLHLDKLGTGF